MLEYYSFVEISRVMITGKGIGQTSKSKDGSAESQIPIRVKL